MAQDKEHIKSTYPLPVYNYRVTVGDSMIGFSEVSGLNIDYEPVTYKHGLSFAMGVKIIPGMRQPTKLTMRKGVVKDKDFLSKWLQDVYANPFQNVKKDILIDLCDEAGKAVIRWKALGALPTKLDAPAFNADSNEAAVETLELIAHDLQVDYHPE